MKTDKKNIIIGYKISDLVAGLISIGFALIAFVAMDKNETRFWIITIFFGLGAIVLLWKYINPKNRFISKNSEEAERIKKEEFKNLHNTTGLFLYNENGFELILEGKLTKTNWNEIKRLIAYKIDLFAVDEICLFVEIDKNRSFEISENTKGWFVFVKKLKEKFPEINQSWEFDIALPPFKRNETELYNRDKNVG